jgi:hypothetical protein
VTVCLVGKSDVPGKEMFEGIHSTSGIYIPYRVSGLEVQKTHAYVLVPKSFIKFMFSTVYGVTQKYFYVRPYTF